MLNKPIENPKSPIELIAVKPFNWFFSFSFEDVKKKKWYSWLVPDCLKNKRNHSAGSNCCCKIPDCMKTEEIGDQKWYSCLVPKCLTNKCCQCTCFNECCKLQKCCKTEEETKDLDEDYIQERIRKAEEENTLFPPDEM